jgi:hypothetical protein
MGGVGLGAGMGFGRPSGQMDACPDSDVAAQAMGWSVGAAVRRGGEVGAQVDAWLWSAMTFVIWFAVLVSAFGLSMALQQAVVELAGKR